MVTRRVACTLVLATATLCALQMAAAMDTAVSVVAIDTGSLPPVSRIDERFQSFQIGMSHLTGGETWKSYDAAQRKDGSTVAQEFSAVREARAPADLENRRLRNLASALAPFYLRYAGTTANSVYFQDNDAAPLDRPPEGYGVVLTRAAWKRGLEFANAIDARVVTAFTVSDGVRDSAGAWTPRMAGPWLAYTQRAGGSIYAAELFNEPNAPEPGRLPKGQSASDFARDFAAFRSFTSQVAPTLKLAGPGVATLGVSVPSLEATTPDEYMTSDPRPKFDIVSYHFYGALAERCAPPDSPVGIGADRALSEEWLARPDAQFRKFKQLRDRHAPGAPIWLTETGAAACGGPKWQTTFLDTFRYADTHARLAKQGLSAMFTHALISGSNGVLDEKTFMPNADYWPAVLWRRLMGTQVLDAGQNRAGLHVYAHCLRGVPGGVSILAINLKTAPAELRVAGRVQIYALTAAELQSRTVLLNERPLMLGPEDTVPDLAPRESANHSITLAPTSVNFIAVPHAANAHCAT